MAYHLLNRSGLIGVFGFHAWTWSILHEWRTGSRILHQMNALPLAFKAELAALDFLTSVYAGYDAADKQVRTAKAQ